jgi:hypothetical protein
MPDAQPAPVGSPLPQGHLLALNRSFRRTLEAENKSPRTVEAYTDAVRFLALYCEAHGMPLLVRRLRREHIQDFITDQLARWKPGDCPQPLPESPRLLQVGGRRGRPPGQPHGRHEASQPPRAARWCHPGRAARPPPQGLCGPGLHQPAYTAIILLVIPACAAPSVSA